MSTNLYWRPVGGDNYLGYQLKFAIAERLWGHDGSLRGEWVTLDRDFISFLQGIAAASGRNEDLKKEADRLVELIHEHGEVEVSLRG